MIYIGKGLYKIDSFLKKYLRRPQYALSNPEVGDRLAPNLTFTVDLQFAFPGAKSGLQARYKLLAFCETRDGGLQLKHLQSASYLLSEIEVTTETG